MNSILRVCENINNKMDILIEKVDIIEKRIETLEKKAVNTTEKQTQKKNVVSLTKKKKINKTGSITIKEYTDCLLIGGDTFDKKKTIKKYKGFWNPEHRGWTIGNKKYKQKLIQSLEKNTKNVECETINNTLLKKNTIHTKKYTNEYDSNTLDNTIQDNIPSGFAFLDDE